MAEVGIGGVGYQGYGAAGGSWLLNGFVAMELARVDASVATFWTEVAWLPGLHGTAASLSVQPMRGANASSPAHAARPRNALRPGVVPRC
jgi:hypothetical protein